VNLVVDIGNTFAKAGVFAGRELKRTFSFEKNSVNDVKKILGEIPGIRHSIISSVINHSKDIVNFLQTKTICVDFDQNTKLPFINSYKTPETLGKDRIAAVAGATSLYPGKALLVIDGGTCMKYNYVNTNNEFIGGAISPGLDMRFKALNVFTDKLPHISYEEKYVKPIGASTRDSILSGVQAGLLFEAEGFIHEFKKDNKDGVVVVTGGNLPFLADGLKNSIFAAPDLILRGLNEILLHHIS
jgi:type III pantothenate kinase